ncbi:MAG: single-stranded DNA-binding protein [Dehalococcoidia bacterium]
MVSVNKIIVIGNLGTDPEMRYTPSGRPVTSFRMAVNHRYTTAEGERREETEWFTVVTWDRLAEQCNQYLAKGRRAYVEGRFRSRAWTGADGLERSVNEIVANQVRFLDRPGEGQSPAEEVEEVPTDTESDDLPF